MAHPASQCLRAARLGALLAAVASCAAPAPPRPTPAGGARLAGTWNVAFTLAQAPLGADTAALRRARRDRVRAHLTFLANRWLRHPDAPDGADRPPLAYGVHDADFAPFGFEAREAGRVPVAIAEAAADVAGGDSLTVLLGAADAPVRIALAGGWRGDSLVGTWRLLGDARSNLGASGTFGMSRAP